MKSVLSHAGLLVLASALAFGVWSKDEKAEKDKPDLVQVWDGNVAGLESVAFEGKQRKFTLVPRKDALGRYYEIRFERETPAPAPKPASSASASGASVAPEPPKQEKSYFLGVKAADEAMAKLVSLKALRALGKADGPRLADYGLDKPEGTLKLKLSGKEQVLTIGGQTPGGGERYARYGSSGEVFAIDGDLVQILSFADSRLMERELHGFEDTDVKRLRISKGAKSREVVRLADKKEGWADAATPTKLDDGVVNWLTKLERLRTLEYVEKPTSVPTPDQALVRIEYFAGTKSLGFLELYKVADKEYLAKSEYTRAYVKVLAGSAEQLDQDLAAVLK